jgi:integrase
MTRKNSGLPPRVYLKNGAYRYMVPDHQRAKLGTSWYRLGTNKMELWTAYSKLQADLNNDGGMMALFDRYARDVIPGKAPRTQKDNLAEMKNLRAVFGKMEPEQIQLSMAYEYLDHRGKTSRTQANHEMALLRHVFSYAVRWGRLQLNPLQGMHKLSVPIRDRTPTPEEINAVRKHADPLINLWLQFKQQTGLRQADLLNIKIADFMPDGIKVKPNKNAKNGRVNWSDDLRKTVDEILAMQKVQGMTLFCDARGKPIHMRVIQSRFSKAVKAAMAAGELEESFTENDVRSSFATKSDELGHDATKQLLHKSPNAKKHYVHRKVTEVTPMDRI